jgi:dUTP pyrophosphatase
MRMFEVVKPEFIKYNNPNVRLPERATKTAVGYDFFSPTDIVIPAGKSELVWTNIKAKFGPTEGLILSVRSSMGKDNVILANAIGVIESDYYGNVSNDGNIAFRLYNFGDKDYEIKVGDKIGQGMFINFLTVDNEVEPAQTRTGGFGSTGK